jgi:hypothetical protein
VRGMNFCSTRGHLHGVQTARQLRRRLTANSYCALPLIGTVSGNPALLSPLITSEALLPPATVGANDTPIEQLAPAAKLDEQPLDSTNSPAFVPLSTIKLILNAGLPPFESVTVCGIEVVPVALRGNVSDVGETTAIAGGRVPPSPTVAVMPVTESVTVILPLSDPPTDG